MAVTRLGDFGGDTIVVYFDGSLSTINAYTFANSLIGFADTARAVSHTIDPGQEIEILLEAYGPGSFRAVIRRLRKGYGGVLSSTAGAILWGVVANIVYDATFKEDPKLEVTVNTDQVIIKHGDETLIVSRVVHEATKNAKKNPAVERGLQRTFEPLELDTSVSGFGLTPRLDDLQPVVRIPRSEFPTITSQTARLEEPTAERMRQENARLVILKAWLNHARRKWSFEWNGVPISAPIVDADFLDRLDRREHLLGAGDALDVEITFKQLYDAALGVYVSDPHSYVVTKVIRAVPRS